MKRIAFTGDLGFSSKYFRGTYDKEDLLHPDLVSYLSDTDYTVVNVEGCLFKGQGSAAKPLMHANPPECVDFLKKINGNIWNIANNHIMDCGREGLESTLQIARENGVEIVGDPEREICCAALCSGAGGSLIEDAAAAGADVLITGEAKHHERLLAL